MGGCSSKPKTAEYEGLMGPDAMPDDGLGRESLDTDTRSVDTVDTGLKSISSSHSAQKGSERSLQTLFVQHESGGEGLVDNSSKALQDVLNSGDLKKQTVSGFSSETNLQQGEVPRGVEEGTITDAAEEGTGSVVKQALEEPTPAVVLTETCVDKAQEVDKERAAAAQSDTNGDSVSETREPLKESIVDLEKLLPRPEPEPSPQESAEPIYEDKASEIAKPADNGLLKDETSGSDINLESSQSAEVYKVVEGIHPTPASEGIAVETLNGSADDDAPKPSLCEDVSPAADAVEGGQVEVITPTLASEGTTVKTLNGSADDDAPKSSLCENVSPAADADAMEGGQVQEKELPEEEILEKTSMVDDHEEKLDVASREVEPSAFLQKGELPEVTPVEHASPVEDAAVTFGTDGEPAECTNIGPLDDAAATTGSSVVPDLGAQLVPAKENEDQSSEAPPVAADVQEEYKSEASEFESRKEEPTQIVGESVEESRNEEPTQIVGESVEESRNEEPTQIVPEVESPPNDFATTTLTEEGGECIGKDELEKEVGAASQTGLVDPENADIKAEKGSEESGNTLSESESAPKEATLEVNQSDLPLKLETNIGEPQTVTSIGTEVAHTEAPENLMDSDLGEEKRTQEFGESIEEMRPDKIQDGSNQCDQIPSTSVPVGEVSQGIELDGGQKEGLEEQDQAKESQAVTAAVEKALPLKTQSIEVAESEIPTEHIPSTETSTNDPASSDIGEAGIKV